MNSEMFDRFLDNLETYLSVRTEYKRTSELLRESGMEYDDIEEATDAIKDTAETMRVIVQNIFESMVRAEVLRLLTKEVRDEDSGD